MAKNDEKGSTSGRTTQETVAKAGLGALVLGVLTWAFGPVSKDNLVEWVKIIVFAVGVALLIRWPIMEPFKIPSGSMEPTLLGNPNIGRGDRVFVNKWIYGVRYPFMNKRIWQGQEPQRWDVVVFKNPEANAQHGTLVKRVIGLPGERVHVEPSGRVFINDELLEPPPGVDIVYESRAMSHPPQAKYGVLSQDTYALVPEGHYLVLGDNRPNSRDGRFFGWLPNGNILGRVACIWWPPQRWRDFTGFSDTWWWKATLVLVGLWLLVRLFFGRSWHVRRSVDDAVVPGEHVYVNRAAFGLPLPFTGMRLSRGREPRRGEVVAYRPTSAADHDLLVGRVAALPGEQVYIDEGRLTVNGRPVEDPGLFRELRFVMADGAAPYGRSKSDSYSKVPQGHYFIIAEDGAKSLDSRTLGWIPRSDMVGTVPAVWWPPRRWRRLKT